MGSKDKRNDTDNVAVSIREAASPMERVTGCEEFLATVHRFSNTANPSIGESLIYDVLDSAQPLVVVLKGNQQLGTLTPLDSRRILHCRDNYGVNYDLYWYGENLVRAVPLPSDRSVA